MQLNRIMYSKDHLLKLEGKKDISEYLVQAVSLGETNSTSNANGKDGKIGEQAKNEKSSATDSKRAASGKRIKTVDERLPAYYVRSRSSAKITERERGIGGYVPQYEHLEKPSNSQSSNSIAKAARGKSILRIIFVEKCDLIIAASEDKNIYVWGFDSEALEALKTLKAQAHETDHSAEGIQTIFLS